MIKDDLLFLHNSRDTFLSNDSEIKDDFLFLYNSHDTVLSNRFHVKKTTLFSYSKSMPSLTEGKNSAKFVCLIERSPKLSVWACVSVTADGNWKGRGMLECE